MSYKDYIHLVESNEPFIEVYHPENAVTYRIYENKGYDELSGNHYHIAFMVTEKGLSQYPTGYRFGYRIPMSPRDYEKEENHEISGNKTINKIVDEYHKRINNSFELDINHVKGGRVARTDKINQNFTLEINLKRIMAENNLKISPTVNTALKEYLQKLGLIKVDNTKGELL